MDKGPVQVTYNKLIEAPDISGTKVNEAARIEPLAKPGGVLISEKLRYDHELDEGKLIFVEQTWQLKKSGR